jgi:hypothetical protein
MRFPAKPQTEETERGSRLTAESAEKQKTNGVKLKAYTEDAE